MYRAEKASSKLCREREVGKAQELHRRKIDGVKSYLTAITRPPAPSVPTASKSSRSSTFFRRSLRQHPVEPQTSEAVPRNTSGLHSFSGDEHEDGYSDNSDNDETRSEVSCDEVATKSFGKLDELRSVLVPVMAYKGPQQDKTSLDYEQYLDAITNPPAPVQEPPKTHNLHQSTHSLRASAFRMRRLKQIEADNVTIFDRIKKSSSHYRTEAFRKDWDQNVAYLTSICEFPVVEDTIHIPSPRKSMSMLPRKRSPFPTRPPDQLPSLRLDSTPVIHPIKAIPTSPKKANTLNLSPAFRSLRKGLPQVPVLPPLTASPRVHHTMKSKSMTAVAGSRSTFQLDDASPQMIIPSPPHSPSLSSSSCVEAAVDRYMLLKIGRFIGGKYLVLTVYCGDGITNPYGFDVVALDPETQLEFHLSISKETTHLLLETNSSSSMAERTAAAAGTNLSMELIAHCICDHIRYAKSHQSEMVFLVATVGTPGGLSSDITGGLDEDQLRINSYSSENACLLVNTPITAMAFCLYQYMQIPTSASTDIPRFSFFHVFARTRPQQCCRASMRNLPVNYDSHHGSEYNGLVCFEMYEDIDGVVGSRVPVVAQAQVSISELLRQFETKQVAVDSNMTDRLSLDCVIQRSFQFLHLEKHTDTDTHMHLSLTVSTANTWECPMGSPHRRASTISTTLPSRHHSFSANARSSTSTHKLPPHDEVKTVLETGMLWRGVYLFAHVALYSPGRLDEATQTVTREPLNELLVITVLNTSTGKTSERSLHGDQVEKFSQKLGAWQTSTDSIPLLIVFAKLLLLRMRLDVDLRGQEVILFPTLEQRYHNTGSNSVTSSRRNSPTKPIQTTEEEHTCMTGSLDTELDAQTHAVTVIQIWIRRYFRRRRDREYRSTLHKTTETWDGHRIDIVPLPEDSLPGLVLAFMRNRAAKRIQIVSRHYAQQAHRRKVPMGDSTLVDPTAFVIREPHEEFEDGELGVLNEDEHEDEEENESRAIVNGCETPALDNDFNESTVPLATKVPRRGSKIQGRFVLQRYRTERRVDGNLEILEHCTIGALFQLESKG